MKIGIDISQIVFKGTGVARFTHGLLEAICKYDKKHQWIFFFSSMRRDLDVDAYNLIIKAGFKVASFKLPPSALSIMWNKAHLVPIETFLGKLDWFITSDWTEPPARCKKATIIHDLAFLRYPETVAQIIKSTQNKRMHWVKKESDVIFADSNSTKQDITELLKIEDEKIHVNYPGVMIAKADKTAVKKAIETFNIKKPFLLTVGKLEPRKNIERLVRAFTELDNEDVELLIVGPRGWGRFAPPQNTNIRQVGYVSDEELAALYQLSLGFVYPSIWEGFGYPVIEAMSLGTPVATSDVSSLGEIARGSAILFNPFEVTDIKRAVHELIHDKKIRERLAKSGPVHAQSYSWEKYYSRMISALK